MAARPPVNSLPLVAEQALYGYQDGHRLLAASFEMSAEDRRLLQRQTDTPDAGLDDEWSALLAGYPLPSGRYAWTMTWPAPEMRRPGCVWTHVVFLDVQAIDHHDAGPPLQAFRRPQGPDPDIAPYRTALPLPCSGPTQLGAKLEPLVATLAWALFEPPTRPVRLGRVALADEERHALLATPWQLTWGDLREKLSVTDAPVTPRELAGVPFDLQLQRTIRRRSDEQARVIEGLPQRPPPAWARALGSEALEPNGLGAFLKRWGPTVPAERESVMRLALLWHIATQPQASPPADLLISQLARWLPSALHGRELKNELLVPRPEPRKEHHRIQEAELLAGLLRAPSLEPFAAEHLALASRLKAVLTARPAALKDLGGPLATTRTPAGTAAVEQLLSTLTAKQIAALVAAAPDEMIQLIARQPAKTSHILWRALDEAQTWEAIRRERGKHKRVDLLRSIIAADGAVDAAQVASSWKDVAPALVVALAESGANNSDLEPWLGALTDAQAKALIKEHGANTQLLGALLEGAPVTQLKELGLTQLSEIAATELSPLATARLFLCSIECAARKDWGPLAVSTYATLHALARDEKLGPAGELLRDLARGDIEEWDYGARLAKALNSTIKHSKWPVEIVLECQDRKAFKALISADDKAGLARRVLETAAQSDLDMIAWQRDMLFAAVREKADREAIFKLLELFGMAIWGAAKKMVRGR